MKLIIDKEIFCDEKIKFNQNVLTILEDGAYNVIINIPFDLKIRVDENVIATLFINNQAKQININLDLGKYSQVNYYEIDQTKEVINKIKMSYRSQINGMFGFFDCENEELKIDLDEEESLCEVNTIALGNAKASKKIKIEINHNAKATTSAVTNYAIAKDESRIIYDVIGMIEKGMHKANANQKTRGIILSPKAHLEANPSLLINDYDVKANHGATIGKISDDDLYYLMSRGISKENAMILIIDGFLNPMLNKIKDVEIKDEFESLIKR